MCCGSASECMLDIIGALTSRFRHLPSYHQVLIAAGCDAIGQNVQSTVPSPPSRLCAYRGVMGSRISRMSTFRIKAAKLKGLLALVALQLAGCSGVVLHPSGSVAQEQGHLIVQSTVLMLIIVVPVIALTVIFAWRYRASNT